MRLIFARLDEKHNCLGKIWENFEDFWWKFNGKIEFLSILGKFVAKNRNFGNNIIFLQKNFPVRGVWTPPNPPCVRHWLPRHLLEFGLMDVVMPHVLWVQLDEIPWWRRNLKIQNWESLSFWRVDPHRGGDNNFKQKFLKAPNKYVEISNISVILVFL